MYYIAEIIRNADWTNTNIIEFSEDEIYLEQKVEKLNKLVEKDKELYEKCRKVSGEYIRIFNCLKDNTTFSDKEIYEKMEIIINIPIELKKFLRLTKENKLHFDAWKDFPYYQVEQIQESQYKCII